MGIRWDDIYDDTDDDDIYNDSDFDDDDNDDDDIVSGGDDGVKRESTCKMATRWWDDIQIIFYIYE